MPSWVPGFEPKDFIAEQRDFVQRYPPYKRYGATPGRAPLAQRDVPRHLEQGPT
jgi:hypothetical protein